MSRYDWPDGANRRAPRGVRRGQAAARRAFNLGLNAGTDPEALAEGVLRHRRAQSSTARAVLAAAAAAPAGGASADRDLWLPAGPDVMLRGLPDTSLRVAGRVRDIAVSSNGERAYAASALGGVWYTDTAGARWEAVGPWAMVAAFADVTTGANTLTCGAIHVRFDPGGNDPAIDEVWVGTGEVGRTLRAPFDTGASGQYAGVGILHAVGPVAATRANPLRDPWTRQAQPRVAPNPNPYVGLRNTGIFSLASDPANPGSVVAATTRGLHHNQTGPAADPWVLVPAWDAISAGASSRVAVTDVVWTPATAGANPHPARLWVSIVDTTAPALNGVWVSTAGVAGPFAQVAIAGVNTLVRPALAADPAFPDVVYVFGSGPRLWRIDNVAPANTLRPATVMPVPNGMFAAPGDQSDYDIAIAIDPANVNRVIIGGASALTPGTTGDFAAALYRLTVGGAAPAYNTDYAGGNSTSPRWIGAGVHADVHRVRWRRVGGNDHVWVCCDGGVLRSTAAGTPATFVSRSTGLAVTECGSVANHPVSDGLMLTGVQDNGGQLRIGDSVWARIVGTSDAGGTAFDPGTTGRFALQLTNSNWIDDGTRPEGITPTWRRNNNTARQREDAASRFYSNAAVVRRADGVTQLVVGTDRVWYSERWGRTRAAGGVWRRDWTTLPSNRDPRAGNANDWTTDVAPSGPQPASPLENSTTGIRALKWAGADRLYAVLQGAIYRFDRNPPTTGAWTRTTIVTRPAPPLVAVAPAWPAAGAANLPDTGAMNDLAVHDATAGPHGSFYVATSHPLEPIWWFDGNARWEPARLGTTAAAPVGGAPPGLPPHGVRAPAYAVVIDPDNPRIVYVGTPVGVWRGEFTAPGAPGSPPTWAWGPFNSGLPEAAVQDLTITTWPRPAGGSVKLLRAALQARGIWEVAPDIDTPPATYLRVHPYDTRRITPTDQRDPMWNQARPERDWTLDWADRRNRDFRTAAGQPAPSPDGTPVGSFHWHGSPDIRLRPVQGGAAVPLGPGLPWSNAKPPVDRFWLWSLQTALRTIDPLVVPDGRWTTTFRTRLGTIRTGLGLPGTRRVNAALWNNARVQAGFWADPWADGGPTEADLIERIVGAATRRVGGVNSRATSPASLAVLRRRYHVDVCVHHRGREPLAAGSVLVILLQLALPANAAIWATQPLIPFPPVGATRNNLHIALDAIPAAGGPLPALLALPAGWAAPDAVLASRRPNRVVATASPAVVTFEVDYSAAAAGARFMLLALVHSTADPLALTGTTFREMILGSRHAAARSIEVI
jgi:hypothetical protein